MTQVFIGVGSNQRRRYHIQRGIELLQQALGPLRCSPVYECAAAGIGSSAGAPRHSHLQFAGSRAAVSRHTPGQLRENAPTASEALLMTALFINRILHGSGPL